MIELTIITDRGDYIRNVQPEKIIDELIDNAPINKYCVVNFGEHEDGTENPIFCGLTESVLNTLCVPKTAKKLYASFYDNQEDMWRLAAGWMEIYPDDSSAVVISSVSKEDLLNKNPPKL